MNKFAIFTSIDSSFFELWKEFLLNFSIKYPNHPIILFCHTNLDSNQKLILKEIDSNIGFIENSISMDMIGPIMTHLNPTHFDPRVFYARFLIWTDIFTEFEKVLHIDLDIYITWPLDDLFEKEGFFMVKEVYEWSDFKNENDIDCLNQLQLDWITDKIKTGNAGVFLITREYLTSTVLLELIDIKNKYHKYIRFADQSIINIWMNKNWIMPTDDFLYNYQFRLFGVNHSMTSINMIRIVHMNWLKREWKLFFLRFFNRGWYSVFIFLNYATRWWLSRFIFYIWS